MTGTAMTGLPSRKDDAPDRSPTDDANVVVPPPRSRLPDHRVQHTQGPPELRTRVTVGLVKAVICWGQRSALNHELRTLPDYVLDDIGIKQRQVRVVNFGGLTAWLRGIFDTLLEWHERACQRRQLREPTRPDRGRSESPRAIRRPRESGLNHRERADSRV